MVSVDFEELIVDVVALASKLMDNMNGNKRTTATPPVEEFFHLV
ncbi:hypothetical protein NV379_14560 [Paenibacillus sp. N1-5-1-14]|nr:hypothetical protein [Paenibacillus radicibacter]MCR8643875.1 hypothetical protein [Paenibacillus radicibacter]